DLGLDSASADSSDSALEEAEVLITGQAPELAEQMQQLEARFQEFDQRLQQQHQEQQQQDALLKQYVEYADPLIAELTEHKQLLSQRADEPIARQQADFDQLVTSHKV